MNGPKERYNDLVAASIPPKSERDWCATDRDGREFSDWCDECRHVLVAHNEARVCAVCQLERDFGDLLGSVEFRRAVSRLIPTSGNGRSGPG